jgi:hypothetical protein
LAEKDESQRVVVELDQLRACVTAATTEKQLAKELCDAGQLPSTLADRRGIPEIVLKRFRELEAERAGSLQEAGHAELTVQEREQFRAFVEVGWSVESSEVANVGWCAVARKNSPHEMDAELHTGFKPTRMAAIHDLLSQLSLLS